MEGKKILLVDDSDILLSVEKLLLEEAGFAVKTAHSLRQVDAVLTSWAPDLILTDVNMPDVTGPELCRHIKARAAAHQVSAAVVLMSSLSDAELGPIALHCGVDAWLSRNETLEALPERVSRLCRAMS
jgi:CheY-like chemotaxis protein